MTQPASLVMTVIGPDRPGLVESLSNLVTEHGGNWLESRMAQLAGQFAGILHVEVPAAQATALQNALLGIQGLSVTLANAEPAAVQAGACTARLEVVGQDRPGIVQRIATTLAAAGVNVEDLQTGRESAPMSADMLFKAQARVQIPSGVTLEDLRDRLEAVSDDLMVDLAVEG